MIGQLNTSRLVAFVAKETEKSDLFVISSNFTTQIYFVRAKLNVTKQSIGQLCYVSCKTLSSS